jgi:hypothetical protein
MTHTITARDVPELRADMVADSVDFSKKFPGHHPWYPSHEIADLFWVCKEMRRLGEQGAASMPEYTIHPDDLPSPHGIMVWEDTVDGAAGVAWKSYGSQIVITVLVPKATAIDIISRSLGDKTVARRLSASTTRARLWSEMEVPLPFGTVIRPDQLILNTTLKAEEDQRWAEMVPRLMLTLFGLMEQPLAGKEYVRPTKHGMKAIRRLNPNLLMETRYVTLRRIENPRGEGDGGGVHYTVRWEVRGHTRWIDDKDNPGQKRAVKVRPHIKGPEGAPFLDPSKLVNTLRR